MRELLDISRHLTVEDWNVYRPVLDALAADGIAFAVGGGHAFAAYSGRWRDTKDLDLYVVPEDRARAVEHLEAAGFADLFDDQPYERHWIHRGTREGRIVDVIFAMANHLAEVDGRWVKGGSSVEVHGTRLCLVPLVELIWAKLYVLQRERADWPDLLNILHLRAGEVDWNHLLDRVGDDRRLLGALLAVLDWLSPGAATRVPAPVWGACGIERSGGVGTEELTRARAAVIDTREWFGPTLPEVPAAERGKRSRAGKRKATEPAATSE